MARKLTVGKAKTILREGTARGQKLTSRQKRFFGFIAGGGTPTRLRAAGGFETHIKVSGPKTIVNPAL